MNNSPRQSAADQPKRKQPSSVRSGLRKIVFPALLAMKLGSAAAGCAATASGTEDDRMADVATPDGGNDAMINPDTGSMAVDAGTDAGSMSVDAGIVISTPEAGVVPSSDAGSMGVDAGVDGGSMAVDAGPIVIPTPSDAGTDSDDAGSMGVDA